MGVSVSVGRVLVHVTMCGAFAGFDGDHPRVPSPHLGFSPESTHKEHVSLASFAGVFTYLLLIELMSACTTIALTCHPRRTRARSSTVYGVRPPPIVRFYTFRLPAPEHEGTPTLGEGNVSPALYCVRVVCTSEFEQPISTIELIEEIFEVFSLLIAKFTGSEAEKYVQFSVSRPGIHFWVRNFRFSVEARVLAIWKLQAYQRLQATLLIK